MSTNDDLIAKLDELIAATRQAAVPAAIRWASAETMAAMLDMTPRQFAERLACKPGFPKPVREGHPPRFHGAFYFRGVTVVHGLRRQPTPDELSERHFCFILACSVAGYALLQGFVHAAAAGGVSACQARGEVGKCCCATFRCDLSLQLRKRQRAITHGSIRCGAVQLIAAAVVEDQRGHYSTLGAGSSSLAAWLSITRSSSQA